MGIVQLTDFILHSLIHGWIWRLRIICVYLLVFQTCFIDTKNPHHNKCNKKSFVHWKNTWKTNWKKIILLVNSPYKITSKQQLSKSKKKKRKEKEWKVKGGGIFLHPKCQIVRVHKQECHATWCLWNLTKAHRHVANAILSSLELI